MELLITELLLKPHMWYMGEQNNPMYKYNVLDMIYVVRSEVEMFNLHKKELRPT